MEKKNKTQQLQGSCNISCNNNPAHYNENIAATLFPDTSSDWDFLTCNVPFQDWSSKKQPQQWDRIKKKKKAWNWALF